MTTGRIKVGIIGLGRSGWNIHAAGLGQHERFDIVAASDHDAERRAEARERYGCTAYTEPAQLLDDKQVELVVIATPSHTHADLAVAALEAGHHVVVEKPLALTTAEADLAITAADKAGKVLTCFHNRRLDPELMAIQNVITSGRLGDLILIRRTISRFARRADWQALRSKGGGELSNTASHLLDQVLTLLNDGPVDLFADLRRTVSPGDAEDHVQLVLRPESGPTAEVTASSAIAVGEPDWLVAGTTGALLSQKNTMTVRWFDPATAPPLDVNPGMAPGRRYGTGEKIAWQEETIDLDPPGEARTLQYYDRLAATLRDGADLFVTPESVRRRIALMDQARAQTGFL